MAKKENLYILEKFKMSAKLRDEMQVPLVHVNENTRSLTLFIRLLSIPKDLPHFTMTQDEINSYIDDFGAPV